MINKSFFLCLLSSLIAVSGATLNGAMSAYAADTATIAIIDMQKVIDQSIIGKAARNNVEIEAKKMQVKISQLKNDLEKGKAELEKQSTLLSGAALDERREKLVKRQRELERAVQDARDDLMRRNGSQIGRVVQEIDGVVKGIAQQRRYTFVLERDQQTLVYADDRLDITDEVIKTLDQKKVAL